MNSIIHNLFKKDIKISNVITVTICIIASSFYFSCDQARGQEALQDSPEAAPAPTPSDIVVTARRIRTIDVKDVMETVSAQTIKAYGANSIADLLDRLAARTGKKIALLVNGRRLAAFDAINALPPEALVQLEVLTASKGQEFGYGLGQAVINLQLKPRFQFATAEADGSVTTEGAGDTENATGRYSRIRNEQRFNAALSFNRQGGLKQSDRPKLMADSPAGLYRSLMPRQDAVLLTLGYARLVGALNLDLSSEINVLNARALTGLGVAGTGAPGAESLRVSQQANTAQTMRTSATVSGHAGRYFWSLLLNGDISRSATTNRLGGAVSGPSSETGAIPGPDVRSRSWGAGTILSVSGPLLALPTGTISMDGNAGIRQNVLSSRAGGGRRVDRYTEVTAQGGLAVPLTGRDWLAFIGDLNVVQRLDYIKNSGIGQSLTMTQSVDWSPFPALHIAANWSSSPGLPGATSLFAPIVERPGVLIYDAVREAAVPVTIISGGRSDIKRSMSTSTNLQATSQIGLSFASLALSLGYMATGTKNPLVSFDNPSPFVQRRLPGLFVRNAAGALLAFDSRPFSGRKEQKRQISASVHLEGAERGRVSPSSMHESEFHSTPPTASALTWDINLAYRLLLDHRLKLGDARGEIDLLATPLSLSGAGSSRHNVDFQWVLGKPGFGFSGSLAWQSGSRVRSLDDQNASDVRFSPLTIVGLEAFAELGKSSGEDTTRSLRIKLAVENLFNRRLKISGYRGLDAGFQSLSSDPYGRTIRLSLRRSL